MAGWAATTLAPDLKLTQLKEETDPFPAWKITQQVC